MSTEITVVNDIVEINVTEDVIVIEAPSGAYPLPTGVYSVYGRTGNVVAQDGDYNLTQLGDVTITNPQTGQALVFNGTTWVNNTETYVGTVTNVSALTLGTSGTDLSSTVVNSTTTPVITLNVPTASATNRGALSSSDWAVFNAKQPALNGIGFVKINGTTISYDNSSYYLASNPSEYIPLTALSSSATGLTYNNTTGVFSTTAGYGIPTTAKQTTWDTAYNDSIVSASVTGVQTKTLTLNQQDGGTITATWSDYDTAPVTSVFGRTGDVIAQSGDYNTLQVTENTNLYFTTQRARFSVSGDATSGVVYSNTTGIIALDDIPNTSLLNDTITINSYPTALGSSVTLTTSDVAEGTNLYYTQARFNSAFAAKSTTDLAEGTNLYFTNARAQAAISGTAPISVASGVVSISQSGPSTDGYLSSADWNTFNAKQSTLTLGNLTSSDITVTGGSGAVVGSGTSMTLATVNSNVGTFGSSTAIPVITVNGKGLVTAVTTDAVFIPSGALSFIGDVTGTGNTGSNTTLTLATVNSNVGAYGDSVTVPTITVNAKGLVTAASQTAIPTSSASTTGLLTSTDWSTFNAKQAQLNGTGFVKVSGTTVTYDNSTYLTTIEGIAAGGELSGTYASPSLVNSAVTGKVLTGLNITGGTVVDTDSILTAFGKVQNQLNGLLGGSSYQGTWNASTNTPALASGVGTKGYYYIVSVAGTTNLDGITDWNIGDWAIYDGTAWQQVDNTDAVVSVNGYTGAVSLTTTDISEGTNEYFTTSRARQSVSAGTGISYDNSTGVITNSAPDQTVSLTASTGISTSGTYPNFTITNTAPDQTVSLTASTGISTSGTYPNFTITNTAPDQVVSLTGAGTTSITGSYPNFTVTSNDQYVGTVTSVAVTETGDALTITGSPITSSGTINIGFAGTSSQYVRGDGTLATFPTTAQEAQRLVTEVYNSTGATLTKGTVVYINGGQGNLPTVTKAQANSDNTSAQTYGVVQSDITDMNNGYVVITGSLTDLDTQAYANGTQLYLSGTTAGAWTSTKPYAPIHLVYVGIVVRSHPTQGVVEIKIQNGYELDELHDVSAQNPTNGDILQYVAATNLWTKTAGTTTNIAEGTNLYYTQARFDSAFGAKTTSDLTEGTNLYFTDARARGAISLTTTGNNGASTYNSTTGVLNVPTYTLAGLGGINLTSLSATSPLLYDNTTGVFSIQQSSGSQAGFLSAADWTTFNNKQAALGYTPVPQTRTLTINGVGYDLSADRSWTITPNVNATNTQDYTATATQTTFTVSGGYTVGQLAVFYNGSKLASNEFTAIDGSTFTLATACQANDIVQAVVSVTGGGIGGSGTTNTLSKWTASGVLGNSLIFDNGTNVGVGTASPAVTLDVNGHIRLADGYELQYGGTSATIYGSSTNNQLRMYTSNTERMRITSSGYVGIGTTSPNATLDVTTADGKIAGFNSSNANGGYMTWATSGTTIADIGTAAQIFGSGGNDTFGINARGARSLVFGSNNTERMRINTDGNIRIGDPSGADGRVMIKTFSPVAYSGSGYNGTNANIRLMTAGSPTTGSTTGISFGVGGAAEAYIGAVQNSSTYADIVFQNYSGAVYAERMRITSGGGVVVGSTLSNPTGLENGWWIKQTSSARAYFSSTSAALAVNRYGSTGELITFDFNGSGISGISTNGSTISYNTGSDYRIKEDFKEVNGLEKVSAIKIYNFKFKGTDNIMDGVIAHELAEILPYAVNGEKDAIDEDGKMIIQGVDYSKIVPVLVKAIQEQQAQIEELKALINK